MQEYKLDEREYKIAAMREDNGKLIKKPFVVCDRNLQRVDTKSFNTAGAAIEWADANFKGLV